MSSAPPTHEPWLPPQASDPPPTWLAPPRWPPTGILLAFAIGLAGTIIGALLVSSVAVGLGADSTHLPSGVNILLTVIQDGAFVAAAVYVASKAARPAPWQFGLRGTGRKTFALWVIAAFLAFVALSAIYSQLVDIGKQEDLPTELGTSNGTVAIVVAAVLVTVVAPICEELFFRGFVFTTLRGWKGTWVATILTGLLFGAIHAGSAPSALYLPILAIFGAVLCLLYLKTGSLYASITLHSINNTIAFGGTFDGWTWQYAALFAGSLSVIALFAFAVRRLTAAPPPVLTAR